MSAIKLVKGIMIAFFIFGVTALISSCVQSNQSASTEVDKGYGGEGGPGGPGGTGGHGGFGGGGH